MDLKVVEKINDNSQVIYFYVKVIENIENVFDFYIRLLLESVKEILFKLETSSWTIL